MADHQTSRHGASIFERYLTARAAIWFVWTLGLTGFFVRVAATNLENFRPVSSDDVWIMSASYKLATQGVFGSDMYAGFFNADQHYFIALPVHHILQLRAFDSAAWVLRKLAGCRWPVPLCSFGPSVCWLTAGMVWVCRCWPACF